MRTETANQGSRLKDFWEYWEYWDRWNVTFEHSQYSQSSQSAGTRFDCIDSPSANT